MGRYCTAYSSKARRISGLTSNVPLYHLCELVFKAGISGLDSNVPKISGVKNVKGFLRAKVMRELPSNLFQSLQHHNDENEFLNEDLHITQSIKEIVSSYFDLHLLRYGQHYSEIVLKNRNEGLRQKVSKLILFKGM